MSKAIENLNAELTESKPIARLGALCFSDVGGEAGQIVGMTEDECIYRLLDGSFESAGWNQIWEHGDRGSSRLEPAPGTTKPGKIVMDPRFVELAVAGDVQELDHWRGNPEALPSVATIRSFCATWASPLSKNASAMAG